MEMELMVSKLKAGRTRNLFCKDLLLHQLWDHGVVVAFHSRGHIDVLHVFGLENVFRSWEGWVT